MHVSALIFFLVEGVVVTFLCIYLVKSLLAKSKSDAAQEVSYVEKMYKAYAAFYYIMGAWLLGWLLLSNIFDIRQRFAGVIIVSALFWVMPKMKKLFIKDTLDRLHKTDGYSVNSKEERTANDMGFMKFFLKKLFYWGVELTILLLYFTVFSIFDITEENRNISIFGILIIVGVLFLAGIPVAAVLSLYNLLKNKGSL